MLLASAGGNRAPVIALERFPARVFAFDEVGPLGIRPTGGAR